MGISSYCFQYYWVNGVPDSQYSGQDHLNPVIFDAFRIRICYFPTDADPDPSFLLSNMIGVGPRLLQKIKHLIWIFYSTFCGNFILSFSVLSSVRCPWFAVFRSGSLEFLTPFKSGTVIVVQIRIRPFCSWTWQELAQHSLQKNKPLQLIWSCYSTFCKNFFLPVLVLSSVRWRRNMCEQSSSGPSSRRAPTSCGTWSPAAPPSTAIP